MHRNSKTEKPKLASVPHYNVMHEEQNHFSFRMVAVLWTFFL
jgi:hypothetical protein